MVTTAPGLHYETIEKRARPVRIAVLTDSSDSDWRCTAVRIIEFLSSIWGGNHSLIVPSDGSTIEAVFWTILEKFSPDYVYYYQKTREDTRVSSPEKYATLFEGVLKQYQSEGAVSDHEREKIDQSLRHSPVGGFGIDLDLGRQIADRLVPFHYDRNFEPVRGLGYIPHDLTGIADVLPCVDHAQFFSSFHVSPEIDPLWWTAHTGAYSAELADELRRAGLKEEVTRVPAEDLGDFAHWIAGGGLGHTRGAVNEALGGGPGFVPPDDARPTPFTVSMAGIGMYGPALSHRAVAGRFACIVGDSLSDFCLSYCLPRIGYRAVWLPLSWVDDLASSKNTRLRSCTFWAVHPPDHALRHGSGLRVCSVSTEVKVVAEVLEVLKRCIGLGLNDEIVNAVEPAQVVAAATDAPTPYCIDSPNQSEIAPFLGDKSVGPIRSPRPTGFTKLNATKHRWVAEVRIGRIPVPTVPHIAQNLVLLSQSAGTHNVRVSQQALAYACPGSGLIIGDDINPNLQNPDIRLFDTFTAVAFVAKANGFNCQLSDKGIYQRDSLAKFGGISEAAKLFQDHSSRAVFRKFLDHIERNRGTYDEGCVLHADKRTYLDLAATQKLMGGDENAAVVLLDKLTAAKVTYRGFVLGCEVCKHAEWYSLADLADEFRCTRCGREQTIRRQHWRQPAAPQIFYKLDEIVYQFLRSDGDVVALSLDYMSRRSKHPFDYSPEIQFRKDNSFTGEIDLCTVWDGVLAIGEAKKQGELASSDNETRKIVNKYERLATMLNARQVLFCTTSPEWRSSTIEAVRRTFQGKLAVPVFLAAEDLLGESRRQD